MIKISVRDYRGIKAADLACAPICLLMAENHAGKSSVALAVAAALTGTPLPKAFELTKGEAGQIIRDGAQSATVRLMSEDGEATVRWPCCTYSTTGAQPPHASEFAAGLASIATMPLKERAAALRSYLKADPAHDDLMRAMEEQFKPESIEALWREIGNKDWDDTHLSYDQKRRDARRDWEKTTGTSFGSEKARVWRPDGWSLDLEDVEIAELERRTMAASAAYEKAIREEAVAATDTGKLRTLAAGVPEKRTIATAKTEAAQKVAGDLTLALAGKAKLPEDPATAKTLHCPGCHKALTLVDGALVEYQAPDPAAVKALRRQRAELDGKVERLQAEKRKSDADAAAAATDLKQATDAEAALAKLSGSESGGAGSGSPVEATRQILAAARKNEAMLRTTLEADRLYTEWLKSDLIVKVLEPSGLRARKMAEGMDGFNEVLRDLSLVAGWHVPVNLTEDLRVRFGERPYPLLSDSEKFRVRLTLQSAQAQIDGSSMIVVDVFDILDRLGRNGAFAMLADAGTPALICMTSLRGAPMPDLAAAGLGNSWVIQGSVARPLGEQEAA